jgi:hypothetical protein
MHDDPKLAYEDKYYTAFSLDNGGSEAEIDLFRVDSLRLFHVVGNGIGGQKLKEQNNCWGSTLSCGAGGLVAKWHPLVRLAGPTSCFY